MFIFALLPTRLSSLFIALLALGMHYWRPSPTRASSSFRLFVSIIRNVAEFDLMPARRLRG